MTSFGYLCIFLICVYLFFIRNFPESLRVIITANSSSNNTLRIFRSRNIKIFETPKIHHDNIKMIIHRHLSFTENSKNLDKNEIYKKITEKGEGNINSYIIYQILLTGYYPLCANYPPFLFNTGDNSDTFLINPKLMIQELLKFYENKICSQHKFANFWNSLALAYIGLSIENLSKILDMDITDVEPILKMFSSLFLKLPDGKYRMANYCLQQAVCELYLPSTEKIMRHHKVIAVALLNEGKFNTEIVNIKLNKLIIV